MPINIDVTAIIPPAKFINNAKVTDLDPLAKATLPREIEVQLPDGDGSKVPAMWHGNPVLAVNDYVRLRLDSTDAIPVVIGAGGATSDDASGIMRNPATANLDMTGYSIVTLSNGDLTLAPHGTGSIVLDGVDWPQADGTDGQVLGTDGAGQLAWQAAREVLTANRTYYVTTTGNDSNDGLSGGAPFLTVQKAVDTVSALDLSTYDVTIDVGNGTYTGMVTLKTLVGSGTVTIDGDTTTPSNVLFSTTSADAIRAWHKNGSYTLQGVKLQTTTSGMGIWATNQSVLACGVVEFGAIANSQILSTNQAVVNMNSNYTISGGATRHYDVGNAGQVVVATVTVTISGTPTFTHFAIVYDQGLVSAYQPTFSGSITGTKYNITMNATVRTDTDKLPGTGGSTATGGQYS